MAMFVNLIRFTDQGIRNIKESPDRYAAFRGMAEQMGLSIKSACYTQGRYDMVVVMEGPEDVAMAVGLKLASMGNVRSETLRGFSPEELKQVIAKMP